MCPPGEHIVHGYPRTCKSGRKTWVRLHTSKNPGKHVLRLLPENMSYLFWKSKTKYPELNSIIGFQGFHELDSVIQFWLEYWKKLGLKSPTIDPLLIKTLIAVESSFNPNVKSKVKGSSAIGLMQVTGQARRILMGIPNKNGFMEMKSSFIELKEQDAIDPISNIAAGTRWLIHKYSQIPKRADKNIFNMIKNYHSWNKEGEEYAKNIFELYKKSK